MATIYKKYALNMFSIFEDVIGKKRKRANNEEIASGFRYQIWKFQRPVYWL